MLRLITTLLSGGASLAGDPAQWAQYEDAPELRGGAGRGGVVARQGGFSSAVWRRNLKLMRRRRENEDDKVFLSQYLRFPPGEFYIRSSGLFHPSAAGLRSDTDHGPKQSRRQILTRRSTINPLIKLRNQILSFGTFGILLENLKPGRITGSRQNVGLKHKLLGFKRPRVGRDQMIFRRPVERLLCPILQACAGAAIGSECNGSCIGILRYTTTNRGVQSSSVAAGGELNLSQRTTSIRSDNLPLIARWFITPKGLSHSTLISTLAARAWTRSAQGGHRSQDWRQLRNQPEMSLCGAPRLGTPGNTPGFERGVGFYVLAQDDAVRRTIFLLSL